ncbi:MAG: hypothetical protein JWO36_7530 [Myxococcales bacterium]|nr:hypothetical protein [Myxococcales bacterium]
MSRLLYLSIISAALAAGCSDNKCGTMGASDTGLTASSDQVTLTYGNLVAGANHDCPAADAPPGLESLTIAGRQTPGTKPITLCVPRPDLLATMPLSLGSDVKLIDVAGDDTNGCMYALDRTRPPTGSASGQGVCANGTDPAGFELVVDGAVSLTRTCGAVVDTIAVKLQGTIAVAGH